MIFAQNNQEFLRKRFGIEKIPSKATLVRISSMADGAKVGKIMIDLMRGRFATERDVVAADGKAICSTAKTGSAHGALQILTAYITSSGVILGQEAIHEKTNEIPTFQQMLDVLDIKGKTVTADAMRCQRETCRKITGLSWLDGRGKWPGPRTIFERITDARGHRSEETCYYISGLDATPDGNCPGTLENRIPALAFERHFLRG